MSNNKLHQDRVVIEMPSRTSRTHGFEISKFRDFKRSDLPTKPKSKAQKLRDLERRKAFLKGKLYVLRCPVQNFRTKNSGIYSLGQLVTQVYR